MNKRHLELTRYWPFLIICVMLFTLGYVIIESNISFDQGKENNGALRSIDNLTTDNETGLLNIDTSVKSFQVDPNIIDFTVESDCGFIEGQPIHLNETSSGLIQIDNVKELSLEEKTGITHLEAITEDELFISAHTNSNRWLGIYNIRTETLEKLYQSDKVPYEPRWSRVANGAYFFTFDSPNSEKLRFIQRDLPNQPVEVFDEILSLGRYLHVGNNSELIVTVKEGEHIFAFSTDSQLRSKTRQIISSPFDYKASWSPDGTWAMSPNVKHVTEQPVPLLHNIEAGTNCILSIALADDDDESTYTESKYKQYDRRIWGLESRWDHSSRYVTFNSRIEDHQVLDRLLVDIQEETVSPIVMDNRYLSIGDIYWLPNQTNVAIATITDNEWSEDKDRYSRLYFIDFATQTYWLADVNDDVPQRVSDGHLSMMGVNENEFVYVCFDSGEIGTTVCSAQYTEE